MKPDDLTLCNSVHHMGVGVVGICEQIKQIFIKTDFGDFSVSGEPADYRTELDSQMFLLYSDEIKGTAMETYIVFHFYPEFKTKRILWSFRKDLNNMTNCFQICQDTKVCCQNSRDPEKSEHL